MSLEPSASASAHPDNDHVETAQAQLATGSRPSSFSLGDTVHLQTPPTSPLVWTAGQSQPQPQPQSHSHMYPALTPAPTYELFSQLYGNRVQFDRMLGLVIRMIDEGLKEERHISQHMAGPLFGCILNDEYPEPDQPRAGFVAELDLALEMRIPDGVSLAETRINQVLRLLYRLTKNKVESTALIQKLDVAIHVATCLPIRLRQGSTSSSTRESQRSAKRQRLEHEQQQRDALFWAVVILLLELKLSAPRVGFAQTCSYALINWDMSGARAAVYMYRTRFTFVLVVDDHTLVVETSDATQWGSVTRMSDIKRFAAHMLPYQLSDQPRAESRSQAPSPSPSPSPSLSQSQGQARRANLAPPINQEHANVLYDFMYDHAVVARSLPVDKSISRNDIVNWTQRSMEACLAEIRAPSARDSTGSRSSWQLPRLADKAIVSSLTSNTTPSSTMEPLRELASICGLTRASDLVKKLKELFPDFEASEEEDAEDGGRIGEREPEGDGEGDGEGNGEEGGQGDGQGDAGEGGDAAGGDGGDGAGASEEGGEGGGGESGGGGGESGGSHSQYGQDQTRSCSTPPSPPPVDDCDGEPDVRWSGIGWRASQGEKKERRPMELESDYDPCSDDDDGGGGGRGPDPIKLARKRQAFTPANALTATMDLMGVKVVWARPGTAMRALREMRGAIERAGVRTPTPQAVATVAAVHPTVPPPQSKGTDTMHEHNVDMDPEASYTDRLGYNHP